jgi:hypothetical protein
MLDVYARDAYLFTSSAFVFNPLPGSPHHFNQNRNSSFFNSVDFRPPREAPGISFPVKTTVEDEELALDAMIK